MARPERICGMHFFNPPALMKLVEVVAGRVERRAGARGDDRGRRADGSHARSLRRLSRLHRQPLQPPVRARVAADARRGRRRRTSRSTAIMREDGGYRMGPFELMDLIGIDVNLEVARSFYRQRPEPRWEPHPIQERMVAAGRLGRKTERGFYEYGDARPARRPEPEVDRAAAAARAGPGGRAARQRGLLRRRRGRRRTAGRRLGDAARPQPSARTVRVGLRARSREGV